MITFKPITREYSFVSWRLGGKIFCQKMQRIYPKPEFDNMPINTLPKYRQHPPCNSLANDYAKFY
jgi:hypothetical protein